MTEKVEILAPAGNMDALIAAVENGADAVYLGGKMFNARQFANNFDDLALKEAINYCHLRKVKVFVTVNTLIKNNELKDAADYVYRLQSYGVDAVIIQDLGLLHLIRSLFPNLEIHGSTQMTVHNVAGVQYLLGNGVKRVVLARETSIEDIRHIRQLSNVELEVFVHGALCISFSGQCLMSSMIGGRSGNRGRCAQPCRMKYSLTDLQGNNILEDTKVGEHLLSPRDLKTIHYIPQLVESGINSFKFEGRMKRPEYVATVIRIYRNALDRYYKNPSQYQVLEEEERELAQIFNRDFTEGQIFNIRGSELMSFKKPNNRGIFLGRIKENPQNGMAALILENNLTVGDGIEFWVTKGGRKGLTVDKIIVNKQSVVEAEKDTMVLIKVPRGVKKGDRVFKTHDEKLIKNAQESYNHPSKRIIPLEVIVNGEVGKPLSLTVKDNQGNSVEVFTEFITEQAQNKPLTEDVLFKQLGRLGNTSFRLEKLYFNTQDKIMVPLSELNKARRKAIQKLENIILKKVTPPVITEENFAKAKKALFKNKGNANEKKGNISLAVHVGDYESFQEALQTEVDEIYLMGKPFRKRSLSLKELESAIYQGKEKGKKVIISLPRFWFYKEEKNISKFLQSIVALKPDGVLVGNLGGLNTVKDLGGELNIYSDYWFNVFNDLAITQLAQSGVSKITLSPELNLKEIAQISSKHSLECIVHGSITLMSSQYCSLGALLGEKKSNEICKSSPCTKYSAGLKDRMNLVFPIETDHNCRMYIFNSKDLCLIENLSDIKGTGILNFRLELQREPFQRVRKLIKLYFEVLHAPEKAGQYSLKIKEMYPQGTTKGHYFRGVE